MPMQSSCPHVAAVAESKQPTATMTMFAAPAMRQLDEALVRRLLYCRPCTQVQGCAEGGPAQNAGGPTLLMQWLSALVSDTWVSLLVCWCAGCRCLHCPASWHMSVLMQPRAQAADSLPVQPGSPCRLLVHWLSSIECCIASPCRPAHACAGAGDAHGAQAAGALALHKGAD